MTNVIDVSNYDFEIALIKMKTNELIICKIDKDTIQGEFFSSKTIYIYDCLQPLLNQNEQGIMISGFIPYPMFSVKSTSVTKKEVKTILSIDSIQSITFDVDDEVKNIYLSQLSEVQLTQTMPNQTPNMSPPINMN